MKWQEPPMPGHSTSAQIEAEVRELKANPGRWALVREGMASTGATMPWKERGCEATSRKGPDGRVDVWARWNGEPGKEQGPDPEKLPDPATLGGYLAARAAREEMEAARRLRVERAQQVGRWRPGGVTSGPPPATARPTRGKRQGR